MSCPPETALHHGKCVPQCPTQHYLDNHSRCRGRLTRLHVCVFISVVFKVHKLNRLSAVQFNYIHLCLAFFVPACHSSCASCWGPSVSQCTLCPAALLLHQGQCVEDCEEGLYSQDSTCHSETYVETTLCFFPLLPVSVF